MSAPEKRIVTLLMEVLKVTRQLAKASRTPIRAKAEPGLRKTAATGKPNKTGVRGIFPHQSQYNPYRVYVWDGKARKQHYVGAFPSMAKAKAAQAAFRAGLPVTTGTKAAALCLVKAAA